MNDVLELRYKGVWLKFSGDNNINSELRDLISALDSSFIEAHVALNLFENNRKIGKKDI